MRQPSICKPPFQIKLERFSTDSSKSDVENVKNIKDLKQRTINENKPKEIISKDTTLGSDNNKNTIQKKPMSTVT
jgi:hypothetical protein